MNKVEANKTYIGVVEDNADPKKLGRVKVRVMDIFDEMKLEDLPWATPWKDINGNEFNVPEKGKVLIVVFDQGDEYKPEFIFSDHYNVNLEKKLESLDGDNYKSMKSLIFDHKTQIYVNDDEGLKIDYKYNNINITEDTIDLNLKDNNRDVNIGDAGASQQAILGNHWMDWFDEFVDNLLGSQAGPYLGNLGAPVVPNPAMISVLLKYKSLRDPVFLSHHVNIVDNNKVTAVRCHSFPERQDDPQVGDAWDSTKGPEELGGIENDMTSKTDEDFKPVDGPKQEYDEDYVAPATDGEPDDVPAENTNPPIDLTSTESNEEVNKWVRFMQSKGYVVYDQIGMMNIVGMRTKDDGTVSNKFDDTIYVFFKNVNNTWISMEYNVTTTPGFIPKTKKLPKKVAVLALGQYIDQYKIGLHQGKKNHQCLKYAKSIVHRNDKDGSYNFKASTEEGSFGINIHRSSKGGSSNNVFNWSKGCQVFSKSSQFKQFMNNCKNQVKVTDKDTFTYTLVRKSDFDKFV
jgi:hypothetical protein